MDSELLQVIAPYAPFLVVAIAFFLQAKIFATPAQLEAVHREILEECHRLFVSEQSFRELQADLRYVKGKLDKIYERVSG